MIHPNTEIGAETIVEDGAMVGVPPMGKRPGELATKIGSGGVVRSGTIIYAGTTIGNHFSAGHGALIREENSIGDHCSVGSNAVLEPGNTIGDWTRIHSQCFLEHVQLGQHVFVGPGVVFTDDPHPMCPRYLDCVLGAVVGDHVSIGGNATILPGIKIGARSLIGAGAVVTRNVDPDMVVAGNPATVIKPVASLICFKGYYERPYIWREAKHVKP